MSWVIVVEVCGHLDRKSKNWNAKIQKKKNSKFVSSLNDAREYFRRSYDWWLTLPWISNGRNSVIEHLWGFWILSLSPLDISGEINSPYQLNLYFISKLIEYLFSLTNFKLWIKLPRTISFQIEWQKYRIRQRSPLLKFLLFFFLG